MEDRHADNPIKIPEISADEFRACEDQDDFLRRYGNPVMIRSNGQRDVICMAREYYERLMQERDLFIYDENIKYWIYEFSMPWEKKLEFDRVCAKCELTPNEFFEAAVTDAIRRAESDADGLRNDCKELEEHQELGLQIQLVRFYPVFKGETEAQALKRKLAEESIEGADEKHD